MAERSNTNPNLSLQVPPMNLRQSNSELGSARTDLQINRRRMSMASSNGDDLRVDVVINDQREERSEPQSNIQVNLDQNAFIEKIFNWQPAPLGKNVLCKIIRRKSGVESLYPQYELFLEASDNSRTFLLAARKRKKKTHSYIISANRFNVSKDKKFKVGSVTSNFVGTTFSINQKNGTQKRQMATVDYEINVLGLKGPRKMRILLPGMDINNKPLDIEGDLARNHGNENKNIIAMHNKSPQWNEDTQSFVLNFHGRVTMASVKNFQIVNSYDRIKCLF